MKRQILPFSLSAIVILWFCLQIPPYLGAEQNQEYLTDAEIDQLRTEEGKEPPERLRLLNMFLKIRYEHAKSVKTGVPYQDKDAKQKASSNKKKEESSDDKKATETTSPKSFKAWMEDYLKCLDEISNNIEDFSTLRYAEPKPYLKSLKNLRDSLEEQEKWILGIQGKEDGSEKAVIDDVVETVHDLRGDVTSSIDELNQQIEDTKDSRKSNGAKEK